MVGERPCSPCTKISCAGMLLKEGLLLLVESLEDVQSCGQELLHGEAPERLRVLDEHRAHSSIVVSTTAI